MMPQQNMMKGTVHRSSSTMSSGKIGRYLLHFDGPTRFSARFLPDWHQEADRMLIMDRALRGNFKESIWNLCGVSFP